MELEDVKKLAEWIADARSTVAFTGAGISTESGIPDFRSPGGVWSRHKQVMYDEFLNSREARARYWKMRIEAYREFAAAQPNAGHLALAELESTGRLQAVITQNIDGLHQLAGSKRVIELHGTARKIACVNCGKEWEPEEVHALIDAGNEAPDCDECAAPLKSKTISFGQAMPIEEMAEAERLAMRSDLFLAIGSSLVVEPAASLPRIAALNGATLVIINRDPTPLDCYARLILRSPIAPTMSASVVESLGNS
ncbi:MAG: Sir2 family NAD-dependent protein deacetylase [Planctomycetes bacterium]|nr:Sir2 family NAD-dependent protein deacetylase [Planctomycetota bacterium]